MVGVGERRRESGAGDGGRYLIAESRGSLMQQDFTRGEQLLGQAQVILQHSPSAELSADVYLAYSSLSQFLGKHALSADYAEKGLAQLEGDLGLAMQVRLLRNLAGAKAALAAYDEALAAVQRAEEKVRRVDDPKLKAEVLLEASRLARLRGDFSGHDRYVQEMLALGASLKNPQMIARAKEAQGLAEQQRGRLPSAEQALAQSYAIFHDIKLLREERRVLRSLVQLKSDHAGSGEQLRPLVQRMVALEAELDDRDRAQAADDFDARLKYVEQTMEVKRLQADSLLAREREAGLARSNRLTTLVAALAGLVLIVLAVFFVQQRRTNALLRSAFAKLHASQAQTQDLLQLSASYVFLLDVEGRIQRANPAVAFALGRSPKALIGMPFSHFLGATGPLLMADFLGRLTALRDDECVLPVHDVQGRERQWRLASRMSEPKGGVRYIVVNGVDVTEQVHQTEILLEQSLRDALTGCFNRRYLDDFERRRRDANWAAIAVDLDRFKDINDAQGHERGDQVLQDIARFLSAHVRSEDAVVRLGGDEFVVLLTQCDQEQLQRLTGRLRQDAANAACGFSMGAALREGRETLAATLARADAAMYSEKRSQQGQPTT